MSNIVFALAFLLQAQAEHKVKPPQEIPLNQREPDYPNKVVHLTSRELQEIEAVHDAKLLQEARRKIAHGAKSADVLISREEYLVIVPNARLESKRK